MKDVGAPRLRQSTRKNCLEMVYYREVFSRDEGVEHFVRKELKLKAGNRIGLKAVRESEAERCGATRCHF